MLCLEDLRKSLIQTYPCGLWTAELKCGIGESPQSWDSYAAKDV